SRGHSRQATIWRLSRSSAVKLRSARGQSSDEGALDHRLALLILREELALDPLLAVVLVLLRHLAAAGDRVAGPHLARKPHLEAAQRRPADIVRHALAHEARVQHAVREHGGIPRRFG